MVYQKLHLQRTINPTDGTHRMGTIGLPIPNTVIKIFDDQRNEVPVGERGEIGIKGPQVMAGYWNRPDATQEVMHGDYFLIRRYWYYG